MALNHQFVPVMISRQLGVSGHLPPRLLHYSCTALIALFTGLSPVWLKNWKKGFPAFVLQAMV